MKFFFNRHSHSDNGLVIDDPAEVDTLEAPVEDLDEEVAAAIALALHKYIIEVREYENTVVTIQQVVKPYSPWSSKIYGLRQIPMRIPRARS